MERSIGNRIWKGTITIMLVGILAKITSFISEAVLAAALGTTYQSDAYYMVSGIKDVLYPMLSVGIWNVFLPLYKEKLTHNAQREADELCNKSITFFTGLSIIIVILLICFANVIVRVVAAGFEGETRQLCIQLTRLSAPMYALIITSSVYASMLQCREKFLGSQIREVASHLPTILAAIFLYRRFGIQVMALALVAGGAIRLLIELPFVDWGYRFKPDFRFRTPDFILILKRLPSAIISAGVVQLNSLVDKAMASTLPEGTISCLNYGHKLMNVFSGLLSSSVATALYPQMVELIALDKKEELGKTMTKIINIFCALMIPVSLACILFRTELVSVVFQRGAFDAASTSTTADVFALYGLGLFFSSCNAVINNIFYGYGDTKTPMYISVANLLMNVALNFALISVLQVYGLALATSLSAIFSFFIRIAAVKKYAHLEYKAIARTGLKVLLASAVACLLPRAIFWALSVGRLLVLILSAPLGVAVYMLLMKLMRVSEYNDVVSLLKRLFKKA